MPRRNDDDDHHDNRYEDEPIMPTMTRDRLTAKALVADEDTTDSAATFLRRCWEDRDKVLEKQEFWIDFLLTSGIEGVSPEYYMSTWWTEANCTQKDSNYNIDVEATTKMLARVIKWARSKGYRVVKEYTPNRFELNITLPLGSKMTFHAEREVMCKKVLIGTEVVPAQEEKVVDKYDWECERVSFLGIDTDD